MVTQVLIICENKDCLYSVYIEKYVSLTTSSYWRWADKGCPYLEIIVKLTSSSNNKVEQKKVALPVFIYLAQCNYLKLVVSIQKVFED